MKMVLPSIVQAVAVFFFLHFCAAADPIPYGAIVLGYTKCVINEHPVAADIAPGKNGNYKWFNGCWYGISTPPSPDLYTTTDGALTLSLGGKLASTPLDFSDGLLPLLPGDKGFYVEFDVQLSDNDPDHFPAVFLMPSEHCFKKLDCYPGDPPHFERWMELDVDEGGYGPGQLGTVHDWKGISPQYQSNQNQFNASNRALSRRDKHTFGASYDPIKNWVTWYVDGVETLYAKAPPIGVKQHFYLIINAATHKKKLPYQMYVSGVRAYVPASSPLPEKR